MSSRPCELKALQTALDPRQPIPQHEDALPRIVAGMQALNAAEKATDDAVDRAKLFANLRARAAMTGVELRAVEDDAGQPRYACTKWAETATFASLAEVAAWLDGIDGGKPRSQS